MDPLARVLLSISKVSQQNTQAAVDKECGILKDLEAAGVPDVVCLGFHMGACQNEGLLLGPLNTRCRSILRTQKGTIILTTTHILPCTRLTYLGARVCICI